MLITQPTWNDDVKNLFSAPYWIESSRRAGVAQFWLKCMGGKQTPSDPGFLINLDKVESVKQWSVTIYNHLASNNMPLTSDQSQFWPADALETFRLWVNQGWRVNPGDPIDQDERIPPSEPQPDNLRIRPDIRSLSIDELNVYRARLDDIMRVGDASLGSPWQSYAYIHTNWCLHYQEAFGFWHRAYLLHLEKLIDHAIPYWDWMAEDSSVEGAPEAGLPEAFLDETYVHPDSGEIRPNPLRFAAAKDGKSKLCVEGDKQGKDCLYVQRNPLFYTTGDDHCAERTKLYAMSKIFQQQVVDALKFEAFSQPQGSGYPWANIPSFDPPQKNSLYPNRALNFDGLYEQPHDNYHGWIGGDMADNSFTAFDPVFFSFHANIDRMLEVWIRNHPACQYTTQVALQPFVGPKANEVNYSSPRHWIYTSIGEMAQDSRRIGYDFGKPVSPQFGGIAMPQEPVRSISKGTDSSRSEQSGGEPSNAASSAEQTTANRMNGPWVVFDGVRCTHDSYFIDVFLNQPDATVEDVSTTNPHYVGRFSRIGMGLIDNKGRCITHGVSRALNAADTFTALKLPASDHPHLSVVVTHLDSQRQLDEQEYRSMHGFVPELVWGSLNQPANQIQSLGASELDGNSDCCSAG